MSPPGHAAAAHAMSRPARYVAALPDAITCAGFLLIWIAPGLLGPDAVRNGMLMMLVEFVLIHATAMVGANVLDPDVGRARKIAIVLGGGLFYLLFVSVFALAFGQWWPFLAFGWLLLGKMALALSRPPGQQAREAQKLGWALSAAGYIVGIFMTTLLPVPRFGLTGDAVPEFGSNMSGIWVDEPHRVIAFGVLYFGFLAWTKANSARIADRVHRFGAAAG